MRHDEEGSALITLQPADRIDPRLTLERTALVEASRNAFPIVATRKARRDGVGLAVGGGVALLLGAITFLSMSAHRVAAPPAQPAAVIPRVAAPQLVPMTAPSRVQPQRPAPFMMPSVPTSAPLATPTRAPVLVFDTSSPTMPATKTASSETIAPSAPTSRAPAVAGNDNEQFASRIGAGEVEVASAQQLTNPSTTVTQGTLIPAVLETAIDTDLPGYVRAVVSRDVSSFDGSRVLIPRSSRLIGQYKSGLAAGQTRAYVIWSRIIRPDGVSVALASPAIDFAGRSGLDGTVDGHFMKRFGSAVLLSVVGGLSAIGNPSVVLSGGQSAASVAAQRDTQIPPTIKVPQGQPIRIFTARDLDFSTVATQPAAAG